MRPSPFIQRSWYLTDTVYKSIATKPDLTQHVVPIINNQGVVPAVWIKSCISKRDISKYSTS